MNPTLQGKHLIVEVFTITRFGKKIKKRTLLQPPLFEIEIFIEAS